MPGAQAQAQTTAGPAVIKSEGQEGLAGLIASTAAGRTTAHRQAMAGQGPHGRPPGAGHPIRCGKQHTEVVGQPLPLLLGATELQPRTVQQILLQPLPQGPQALFQRWLLLLPQLQGIHQGCCQPGAFGA